MIRNLFFFISILTAGWLLNGFLSPAYAAASYPASSCNFPDTNQKVCYNASGGVITCPAPEAALAQDGSYNPSAAKPSYTVFNLVGISSVTVDNRTGLMWITDPSTDAGFASTMTWEQALSACENLTYAGYTDWRLPNIMELMSLVDYSRTASPLINIAAFPNTVSNRYWSSTTYAAAGQSAYAWYVFFGDGIVYPGDKVTVGQWTHARCVRGGP
ncbi:MAG: DUF1566 domain-containing protein [Elusimicrobiota bacterium]